MGSVEHPAIVGYGTRTGVVERRDDSVRRVDLGAAGLKHFVDDRNLIWMNRELPREAVAVRIGRLSPQTCRVTKARVNRVDGCNASGVCRREAQ